VKAGRIDEARMILGRLRGKGDRKDLKAFEELRKIVAAIELERQNSNRYGYISMLTRRVSGKLHLGRPVQLSLWLLFLQA